MNRTQPGHRHEDFSFYQNVRANYGPQIEDVSAVASALKKMIESNDPVKLLYEWTVTRRFGLLDFRFLLSAVEDLSVFRKIAAQSKLDSE